MFSQAEIRKIAVIAIIANEIRKSQCFRNTGSTLLQDYHKAKPEFRNSCPTVLGVDGAKGENRLVSLFPFFRQYNEMVTALQPGDHRVVLGERKQ